MTFFSAKKLGAIGIGFLGTAVVNRLFNYLLYPAVIVLLGPLHGGAVMTVAALVLNYLLVVAYDQTNQDWFGFEWLRLQRERGNRFLRVALKGGYWPVFIVLSCEDPFKAFVFVRGRRPTGGKFTHKDWVAFGESNLIGNLFWVLVVSGGVGLFKQLLP